MNDKIICLVLILIFTITACQTQNSPNNQKINGLTFVAPPRPFTKNPMTEIKQSKATWIATVPYAFTRQGNPELRFNTPNWQWWGERSRRNTRKP